MTSEARTGRNIQILRPSRRRIGHSGVVLHKPISRRSTEETKPNTTSATCSSGMQKKTTQYKETQKLQPGLVASYDLRPGNCYQ